MDQNRTAELRDQLDGSLLLVGAGKMGRALLEGWLKAGVRAQQVLVQEPKPEADFVGWCERLGVNLADRQVPDKAPCVLVLAVKPQIMADVLPTVAPFVGPQTVSLSIAAGKTLALFEAALPAGSAVVRAMPNTPAAIGCGMTVLCANAFTTPNQRSLCEQLMAAVGEVGWLTDEGDMDAVTAVSGSGPAYVFLLVEAMTQAGIDAGLTPDLAAHLAHTTVVGSAALLGQSHETPTQLRVNVTSPGGTTQAALDVLMADQALARLMSRAIAAAVARSRALSQ